MKKSNSIVRTITINGNPKNPDKMHYKIDFMTFSKALSKENPHYQVMHETFKIYPYKWYDIRWIYEIPAYWFLFRILHKSESNISRQMHNRTSTIVLVAELLSIAKPTIELIKLFI